MTPQSEASKAIEAILMVAQEPVDPHLLAQVLEVSPDTVKELCRVLQESYAAEDRGFVIAKVAGGYRYQSHADLAAYVERFVLEGQSARLSAAALETLAIVAYKQPISRAQVASIRGVSVDGVMRTLQQRGYVEEVGRDPGPGQATLFGTSDEFLERLGLDSVKDLPAIAALFPSSEVMEALERGLRVEPETTDAAVPSADSDASTVLDDDAPAALAWPETSFLGPAGDPAPLDDDAPGSEISGEASELDEPAGPAEPVETAESVESADSTPGEAAGGEAAPES